MNNRLLVALDGSKLAEAALAHALRLAGADAEPALVHVVPHFASPVGLEGPYRVVLQAHARQYLLEVRRRMRMACGEDIVLDGEAAPCIREAVNVMRPAFLAMGTHARRAPLRWVMGSAADKVLRMADVPVLFVREGMEPARKRVKRILVALDGMAKSERILEDVRPLAEAAEADVVLLHVADVVHDPMPQFREEAPHLARDPGRRLQRLADDLDRGGVATDTLVAEGDPATQILARAKRLGAGVIAMATRAPEGLERAIAGSVAEEVIRRAAMPVLLRRVR